MFLCKPIKDYWCYSCRNGFFAGGTFFSSQKHYTGYSYVFYCVVIFSVIRQIPLSEFFSSALLLFIPLIIVQYLLSVRTKRIPGTGALLVMASGFLLSITFQTIVHKGAYSSSLLINIYFLLAVSVFFVYMCFLLSGISLSDTFLWQRPFPCFRLYSISSFIPSHQIR